MAFSTLTQVAWDVHDLQKTRDFHDADSLVKISHQKYIFASWMRVLKLMFEPSALLFIKISFCKLTHSNYRFPASLEYIGL